MKEFTYPPGATPLDPDELEGLKLPHITTRGELDRWEHENILAAVAWLERRQKREILNEIFVRQLHEKMFDKVWKWAGNSRRSDKNIGGEWRKLGIELRQLLDDIKYWIEHKIYSPDEIAYRFHHRLVLIHFFPNGNGRHARLMTDTLLTEILKSNAFTWGSGDLTNPTQIRKRYIAALKAADKHNYELLQDFVRS